MSDDDFPEGSNPRLLRLVNRKIHVWLGLYFLLFIWLFAFSGLVLNHQWKFTEFYPSEEKRLSTHVIQAPATTDDRMAAKALAEQLQLRGEVGGAARDEATRQLRFQVQRPGTAFAVTADLAKGTAEVEQRGPGGWRLLHTLHTFTGVSLTDAERQRNWPLTYVWIIAMDALALGLIVMLGSGFYLWWQLRSRRAIGLVSLGAGSALCLWLLFGLASGLSP
jgi:hypothetical protein